MLMKQLIIPIKKPILDKKLQKAEKISKGIIKPKHKPKSVQKINPKIKKSQIVKKKEKKINFLIPKSKPLVVKKEIKK